jgi:hypothetical protein
MFAGMDCRSTSRMDSGMLCLKHANLTIITSIQEILPHTPAAAANPNPPASPATIDALPMVVIGQVTDEFNQTEWSVKIRIEDFSFIISSYFSSSICGSEYEANEEVKRLPCGHFFHAGCVSTWLSITRICPVCRQRIPSANL